MEKREKFTTTLNPSTLDKLAKIKIDIRTNENTGKKIRGLNEVIEILVDEKWRDINDKDKK